jgi:hypothetical protein
MELEITEVEAIALPDVEKLDLVSVESFEEVTWLRKLLDTPVPPGIDVSGP